MRDIVVFTFSFSMIVAPVAEAPRTEATPMKRSNNENSKFSRGSEDINRNDKSSTSTGQRIRGRKEDTGQENGGTRPLVSEMNASCPDSR
ncbi:hypothetical protein B0H11DRAFT_2039767 [Mycena galericulata]|nr:hypothetical protein B0H11DRAFT_2039767 [Mycena galericulata]